MAFGLKENESIAAGICRASRQQLKRANREMGELPGDSAVHDIRKRFKRVRALARLVRASLGERRYRSSNKAVRDAGKPLAELRDAEATMGALERLVRRGRVSETAAKTLRDELSAHYDVAREGSFEAESQDTIHGLLRKARKSVRKWKIGSAGWKAIEAGLTDTYEKAQQAFLAAAIDPSISNLHEWRKQVKYLWNEIEFIKRLRPRALGRLAGSLHRLGDLLGDDHDLAVLVQTFEKSQAANKAAVVEELAPLIHEQRRRFEQKAFRLGEQLFEPQVRQFVKQLKRTSRRKRRRTATSS
ncbi:MAG TPA: CHAD domain-containing protein [Pirellulales bacterium]|nr:CHAD domain-containing protein [Pirellulales bacterium]